MNGKIDINLQTNLSEEQCVAVIGIWNKLGVFTTMSDVAGDEFKEVKIWAESFHNYSTFNDRDTNKLTRLTKQVIEHYKLTVDYAGVDRISINKNGCIYGVICKPTKSEALRNYSRRVSTAATHIVKADFTNEGFELGHKTFQDMLQKVETHLPNLFDRLQFFQKIQTQILQKQLEASKLLEGSNYPVDVLPDNSATNEAKESDLNNNNNKEYNALLDKIDERI